MMQVFIFVVFFLNYLIAIVSDSYDQIKENQALAVRQNRHELNRDLILSEFSQSLEEHDLILVCSVKEESNNEWQGLGSYINR